ncbi:MAG: hypothetical protein ACOVNW_02230 [Flavobacterium sp.]|jgi:hypothetical protein
MKRRKDNSLWADNTVVSFIVFYFVILVFRIINGNFYLSDSHEYVEVAKYLLEGNYFSVNDPVISKRPLIYPLFLSLTITLSPYIIIFFQSVLLSFTFHLFFKILEFYKIKKQSALILIVLTPSVFIYSQLIMSELLVLFLVTLLFYLYTLHFSWKAIKYAQLIILLLAFTKPVFYPFVFVNFVIMLFYFLKVKRFNFWVLLPIITVLLYTNYNQSRFGYRHFSSIENTNLIHYNLYYFKAYNQSKKEADDWLSQVTLSVKTENSLQKDHALRKIALDEISTHFFPYTLYHLATGIRGVFDPGRFDLMTLVHKEDGNQGFLEVVNGNKSFSSLFKEKSLIFIYLLLIPIMLALIFKWIYFFMFYFKKRRNFTEYFFLIFIIYYVLATGPVNCSRYMMPLQLILITFALVSVRENRVKNASQN